MKSKELTFGEQLKALRLKKGLSIKKLAPLLGVHYTHISKIENNRAVPSSSLIHKIAEAFDYDEDFLSILAKKPSKSILDRLIKDPAYARPSFKSQKIMTTDTDKQE